MFKDKGIQGCNYPILTKQGATFLYAKLRDCLDYFMIPLGGASDELKNQAAVPQAFLLPKLAEASFARSDNKKPTKFRGF